MKAMANLKKFGYTSTNKCEMMELWFEIRRFQYRRFVVGPGFDAGASKSGMGELKYYVLEFLKSHALRLFSQARQHECPDAPVYDPDLSTEEYGVLHFVIAMLTFPGPGSNSNPLGT